MLSCCSHQFWPYHLNVTADSSSTDNILQFSVVQLCWAHAYCRLGFLFLANRSGTQTGFLLLWPVCLGVLPKMAFLVIKGSYLIYCQLISKHSVQGLTHWHIIKNLLWEPDIEEQLFMQVLGHTALCPIKIKLVIQRVSLTWMAFDTPWW